MHRVFDRRPEFDDRSRAFPVQAVLPRGAATPPRSQEWACETWLDQLAEGACVGFAWAHELAAAPHAVSVSDGYARDVYHAAQQIDEWAPSPHSGTSVLAGAKIVKQRGWINEYRWAFGLADLILAVGYKGPAVLGVTWFDSMFSPDSDGFVRPQTGQEIGGHAILARAVDVERKRFVLHNSWGKGWGRDGEAFLSFDDAAFLLNRQGEACVPIGRHSGDAAPPA